VLKVLLSKITWQKATWQTWTGDKYYCRLLILSQKAESCCRGCWRRHPGNCMSFRGHTDVSVQLVIPADGWGVWRTGRGSSAWLPPILTGSGRLTAYLGGHVFPQRASQFFHTGVLSRVSFPLLLFFVLNHV